MHALGHCWQAGGIPFDFAENEEEFREHVHKWFEPFGKIDDVKVRTKDRSVGSNKSYCLVTFSLKGGQKKALEEGVEVPRTKMSQFGDTVKLILKEADRAKKKQSPLAQVKLQQRVSVLQRAVETYDKFLNPDGKEPHETTIQGLKRLAAMQISAGMSTEAAETQTKAQTLEKILNKRKAEANKEGSASSVQHDGILDETAPTPVSKELPGQRTIDGWKQKKLEAQKKQRELEKADLGGSSMPKQWYDDG